MDRSGSAYSELREYLWLLWVRKWSFLTILGLVLMAAVKSSSGQLPVYLSSAEVLVRPPGLDPASMFRDATILNLEPERRVAASPQVAALARAKTSPAAAAATVAVQAPPGTSTLVFLSTAPTAVAARDAAAAYADAYLTTRQLKAADDAEKTAQPVKARIADLTRRIGEVQRALAAGTAPSSRAGLQTEFTSLSAERQSAEFALYLLNPWQRFGSGQLLEPAILPSAPIPPAKMKALMMGAAVGLAFGLGQAVLRARFRPRLHGRADLAGTVGGPTLGMIPNRVGWRRRRLVTLAAPRSAGAEAYRRLRAGVSFDLRSRGLRTLLVTGPGRGEDTGTVAANLAVSLAQAGQQVVLVSADLHGPGMRRFFPDSPGFGLTSLLADPAAGTAPLATVAKGLRVLHCGPVDGTSGERLASDALPRVLATLEADSAVVVIDAPGVLESADPLVVAGIADGVLLVATAERTTVLAVTEARYRLEQVGARVIGGVLLRVPAARARFEQRAGRGARSPAADAAFAADRVAPTGVEPRLAR